MPSQPTSSTSSTSCLLTDLSKIEAVESPTAPASVRSWALSILESPDLDTKLKVPLLLCDDDPGVSLRIREPARTAAMRFQRRTKQEKLPKANDLSSSEHRAICLHRFGGHELLAVEMIAWALLAFPEAPHRFRKALVHQLQEEQEHVRLYQQELKRFGLDLGDLPMYRHVWTHLQDLDCPLTYLSCINLTLEQANLDFAPMYGAAFARVGDDQAAALMARIFADEIGHVRLGWRWFERLRADSGSSWEAWMQHLPPLLHPIRARGGEFRPEGRRAAGLPEEWIIRMRDTSALKLERPPRALALARPASTRTEQQTKDEGGSKGHQDHSFGTA